MVYEDLQYDYVTVGSNTQFISSYEARANPYDRDVDEYVYNDKGAGHFGDFEHFFDVYLDSASHPSASYLMFWGISNIIDDIGAWAAGLTTTGERYLGKFYFRLAERGGTYDTAIINCDTWYYCRIERSGTTLTLKIYSTAALRAVGGTPDIDTLQITVATTTYRYIYALSSLNSGVSARDAYGNIKNIDLREVIYTITGTTRDADGNPLGNCIVWLFRTGDKAFQQATTSDANGNYSFEVPDNTTEHFIRSHKDGAPNVFGTTDRNVVGS